MKRLGRLSLRYCLQCVPYATRLQTCLQNIKIFVFWFVYHGEKSNHHYRTTRTGRQIRLLPVRIFERGGQADSISHRISHQRLAAFQTSVKIMAFTKPAESSLSQFSACLSFFRTRSNLSQEDTDTYAALISQLSLKANGIVRTLDEADSLTFLRLRSTKHEIMVAPDKDYILIVIQNPHSK